MNPKDIPDFWERPASPPPARKIALPGHYAYDLMFYEGHLVFQGDTARNKETGSVYHYTEDGWANTPPGREDL